MVLESLEPKAVWEIFEYVFSVTPRESKKEGKIRAKLKSWIPGSFSTSLTVGILLPTFPDHGLVTGIVRHGRCAPVPKRAQPAFPGRFHGRD